MLRDYGLIKSLIFIFLIVTIVGCKKKTANPINPESLPPTFSQILIVKNETADEIHMFPAPGSIGEPLILEPGESITMNFIVNRKASLDESGNPKEDGWIVEIDKQHKFLGMRNTDGLLRIKTSKGELWEYRIDLGKCWFENKPPTKDHELIVHEKGPDQSAPAVILCD
ncbi:MAG TPA: hypothetical protein VGA95_11450 [Thermodesulfobacteriota bacterium]